MTYDDDEIPEDDDKDLSPFDFAQNFATEFGANMIFFATFQELSDQIEKAEQRKAHAILNHDSGSLIAAENDFKILIDAFQKGAETLEDGA